MITIHTFGSCSRRSRNALRIYFDYSYKASFSTVFIETPLASSLAIFFSRCLKLQGSKGSTEISIKSFSSTPYKKGQKCRAEVQICLLGTQVGSISCTNTAADLSRRPLHGQVVEIPYFHPKQIEPINARCSLTYSRKIERIIIVNQCTLLWSVTLLSRISHIYRKCRYCQCQKFKIHSKFPDFCTV